MSKGSKIVIKVFVVVYICCLFVYMKTPITTDIVKFGTLEDSINISAYVILKESLIYSDVVGNFEEMVKEGERVSKNTKLAAIYKDNVDVKIQENIQVLNERISDINKSQMQSDIFANDLQRLDSTINNKVNEVISISYNHNATKLSKIKEDINKILEKKSVVSGEKGSSGYNLESLKKEKEVYEARLSASKIDLIADVSGVVSYNMDGMEHILDANNIEKFTPTDFQELDTIKATNDKQSKAGQPIAKIIDNFEWNIGFLIEHKAIQPINIGDIIDVRFRDMDNYEIDARVCHISQEEDGKVVVVLSLNKHIDSIYGIRKVNVDIVKRSHTGFKIPLSAIRVIDGKTGVYINKDRVARFREIEIMFKNDNFAIVKENNTKDKNLLLYDEIIIKGSNDIEEGRIIK